MLGVILIPLSVAFQDCGRVERVKGHQKDCSQFQPLRRVQALAPLGKFWPPGTKLRNRATREKERQSHCVALELAQLDGRAQLIGEGKVRDVSDGESLSLGR